MNSQITSAVSSNCTVGLRRSISHTRVLITHKHEAIHRWLCWVCSVTTADC